MKGSEANFARAVRRPALECALHSASCANAPLSASRYALRMTPARALAFRALGQWRSRREFADQVIRRALTEMSLGRSDRGFAQELFYGVLRNLTLLDFWIGQLRASKIEAAARAGEK